MNGTTNINAKAETDALVEATRKFGEAQLIPLSADAGAPSVLSLPEGRKAQSIKAFLDEYLKAPERKKGTARLTTLDSFIAHVLRTKDEHSAIFAIDDPKAPKFVAVYDYNQKDGVPRFAQHRAEYPFPVSDEWKAWMEADDKPMKQPDFAAFLEDRIVDVLGGDSAQPGNEVGERASAFAAVLGITLASPQKLMTLARGLTIKAGVLVTNAQNLSSGEMQITFAEDHKDENGNELRVPGGFAIAIPIFRGGAPYKLPVRLRYRREGGQILWIISLYRTDESFHHALKEAIEKTEHDSGLPVFAGAPEA